MGLEGYRGEFEEGVQAVEQDDENEEVNRPLQ